MKIFSLFTSLMLLVPTSLHSATFTESQAVRAIIGEAANQGPEGMLAVAGAIRNRGTLRGVYGLKAPHVDKQPAWVWRQARTAWAKSATTDTSNGATHWESTDFKVPAWARDMVVTARVGKHVFYRPK